MADNLDIAMLYRPCLRDRKGSLVASTQRRTVDFLVNGVSLF
jgi:hypothetical protein